MKRVIGIGNALTDMLVNLESDSVLRKYLLEKGSMSLVNSKLQTEISKSVAGLPYSLSLGGSAGNTIRAMARLGCETGFIGTNISFPFTANLIYSAGADRHFIDVCCIIFSNISTVLTTCPVRACSSTSRSARRWPSSWRC